MKFKLTIEIAYEITDHEVIDYYDTTDPEEVAEIDRSNFDNDLGGVVEMMQNNEFVLKVEPVK